MNRKPSYLAIVPTDATVISSIRAIAKRNGWRVTLRGRNRNRKAQAENHARANNLSPQFTHQTFRRDIPIRYSDRVAVYVRYTPTGKRWSVNVTPDHFVNLLLEDKIK